MPLINVDVIGRAGLETRSTNPHFLFAEQKLRGIAGDFVQCYATVGELLLRQRIFLKGANHAKKTSLLCLFRQCNNSVPLLCRQELSRPLGRSKLPLLIPACMRIMRDSKRGSAKARPSKSRNHGRDGFTGVFHHGAFLLLDEQLVRQWFKRGLQSPASFLRFCPPTHQA